MLRVPFRFGVLPAAIVLAGAWAMAPRAWSEQSGARGPADFGIVVSPGAQIFLSHCAPCHGRLGRGDGPAAAALRTRPVDLSRLAANNGGTFPTKRVEAVLRFGVAPAAHGSTDMPAWGPLFTAADGDAVASQRIADLLRHLEGLRR